MLLLDTSALIWYALAPERLGRRAARAIRQEGNYYSHVSVWEMAIKSSLGKLQLRGAGGVPLTAKQFVLKLIAELQLSALPLNFDDVAEVEALPLHHRDPFDRLLVVQAQRRDLPIVSADPVFDRYGLKRVW